ncbi:Dyp-type peroxidase [Aestuariibacter halophilus]|uniref:Dyp-type peroxidase n=1 Tax=Fluctibacter halophilus TaxID=226011 RepID=A0ABS8G9Z9_9ALTE|nr:Dyp-type peroxidase [Aestuariibacter halophilus]MCC2617407.1 Dyp-type peroxidase [Aestuariibacter halophilus]
MSQPQKGICAEPNLHAHYVLLNVIDDDDQAIRMKLARILDVFEHYDNEHYEAMVSGVIGVGSNYWMEIYPGLLPMELAPFPDMQCGERIAPAVPCDLYIQIRADRADICYAIAMEVFNLLREHIELIEHVQGFRYLDGRDLTGFITASNNPRGMKKFDVAVVGDQDPDFAGGSYIHVQRYRHDLPAWQRLSVSQQESIMGRRKEDDKPLDAARLSPACHFERLRVEDPDGHPWQYLDQSMPYGDLVDNGLFFVSCAATPKAFTEVLTSRIFGDQTGQYDSLLDYSIPETGAAFFAPSASFIKRQARG